VFICVQNGISIESSYRNKRKEKIMDKEKQKLIDEIEEQATQYDMDYTG